MDPVGLEVLVSFQRLLDSAEEALVERMGTTNGIEMRCSVVAEVEAAVDMEDTEDQQAQEGQEGREALVVSSYRF